MKARQLKKIIKKYGIWNELTSGISALECGKWSKNKEVHNAITSGRFEV